jgi:tRNA(adenine34) deaminase
MIFCMIKQQRDEWIPPRELVTCDDELYMREALKEAFKAFQNDEVPVGAVIVKDRAVIGRAHNQVELLRDVTAHAELLAIGTASSASGNWRLENATLYCTLEPCAMCAGAILLSRLEAVVWGAKDMRMGANGSWVDLFSCNFPMHTVAIRRGVFEEWSQRMLKEFFKKKRVENGT